MIIVTGGAGFIGANLIQRLNLDNRRDIIVVDNIKKNQKNLNKITYRDYFDKQDFLKKLENKKFNSIKGLTSIIHLGACSDTTETNWDYLKYNNIYYTKKLYQLSKSHNSQFIYASSASVYGIKSGEQKRNTYNLKPLNLYAKSKYELDQYFFKNKKKVMSLRFFNVYGKFEDHKAHMSSPVSKFLKQLKRYKQCQVFNFKNKKEAKRDFVLVDDAIDILLFLKERKKTGIFNIGSGKAEAFSKIAKILISNLGYGNLKYVNFPDKLNNKYQYFTKANISKLRTLGYKKNIKKAEIGIKFFLGHI
tara:strand:- start:5005 stop:5919 length:915 start_codon:yes stop_codon:yes gene_type:complete